MRPEPTPIVAFWNEATKCGCVACADPKPQCRVDLRYLVPRRSWSAVPLCDDHDKALTLDDKWEMFMRLRSILTGFGKWPYFIENNLSVYAEKHPNNAFQSLNEE